MTKRSFFALLQKEIRRYLQQFKTKEFRLILNGYADSTPVARKSQLALNVGFFPNSNLNLAWKRSTAVKRLLQEYEARRLPGGVEKVPAVVGDSGVLQGVQDKWKLRFVRITLSIHVAVPFVPTKVVVRK